MILRSILVDYRGNVFENFLLHVQQQFMHEAFMAAPTRLLLPAARIALLGVVLYFLLALHLWMLDMGSSLRTQFMLGESEGHEAQTLCELDTRPLAHRLQTALTNPRGLLCALRPWALGIGEDTIVRHIFNRIEL